MKKSRIYLIIQALVCIALVVLLSVSAVTIYREGAVRKAQNPLEDIYTPAIVAERFAPIAPLFLASLVLLIIGLALGIRDEDAEKPVKDSEIVRDLTVSRVASPSEDMRREQALQKRLGWLGWGAFALCMVPVAVYLTNPSHFPQELEDMFYALIRVFLPCAAVGLGVLGVAAALRERSVLRETEAAKARIQEEKAQGVSPAPAVAPRPRKQGTIQAVVLVAAVALIIAGIFNGSARDVLYKAITICTECVGLG